jgi:hypothetical protein
METKPYNLQSPEEIAKDYGGNKQAIARAVQAKLVDPTAAVLAGMFIDRVRSAAAQEQSSDQTVFERTFAPPQAPAGLGVTPQAQMLASAMPAPGQAPPIAAPQGQPTVNLANGGLAAMELPDDMYDYAGGGLVAFAKGEEVVNPRKRDRLLKEMAVRFASQPDVLQRINTLSNEEMESMLGFGPAVASPIVEAPVEVSPIADRPMIGRGLQLPGQARANLGETLFPTPEAAIQQGPTVAQEAPGSGGLEKYVKEYQDLLAKIPGADMPEKDVEARRKENLYAALANFGFTLAGTPGDLLTGAAKAGKETTPMIMKGVESVRAAEDAARKARRAEQIEALKGGMGLYGKELDRAAQIQAANISAGKGTDMSRYAADVLAASKGDEDAAIRVAAVERYLPMYGASGVRGQAALAQADIAAQRVSAADFSAAQEYAQGLVGLGSRAPERKKYNDLIKEDRKNANEGNPTNLAEDYKQGLVDQYLKGLENRRGGAPTAPAAPASAASARGAQGTKENPLSMPQRKEDLVKDKVYTTARGLATWNGNQFVSVK